MPWADMPDIRRGGPLPALAPKPRRRVAVWQRHGESFRRPPEGVVIMGSPSQQAHVCWGCEPAGSDTGPHVKPMQPSRDAVRNPGSQARRPGCVSSLARTLGPPPKGDGRTTDGQEVAFGQRSRRAVLPFAPTGQAGGGYAATGGALTARSQLLGPWAYISEGSKRRVEGTVFPSLRESPAQYSQTWGARGEPSLTSTASL